LRRITRKERGNAAAIGVLIALVFAGGAFFIDLAQQSVSRKEPEAAALTAVALKKVDAFAPPSDPFQRRCVLGVARSYSLTWDDAQGWTALDEPRPALSHSIAPADVARDQAIADDWANKTDARVNLGFKEWKDKCLKDNAPDGPGPLVTEKDPRDAIAGKWYLRRDTPDPYAGTANSCVLPPTMTISFDDGTANIVTVTFEGKQPEKAQGFSPREFSHEVSETQNGLRFEIGLIVYDGKDAISGQFHDQPGIYLCTTGFTGLKAAWPAQ
jgi:hypothetical protein